MKRPGIGVLGSLWMLLTVQIVAQERVSLFHLAAPSESAVEQLREYVEDGVVLKLNRTAALEALSTRAAALSFDLPLSATETVTIPLQAAQIMAPQGRVVAGTDQGDVNVDMHDQYVVYANPSLNVPRRARTLMITPRQVMGLFEVDGDFVVLGCLDRVPGFGKDDYIVYRSASLKSSSDFMCGAEEFETPTRVIETIERIRSKEDLGMPNTLEGTNDLLVSDMAIEADYQTFQHWETVENAATNLLFLVSCASALYLRDVNVQLRVPYLRVWTTTSDPYNDNPPGSTTLLNEFRAYWNANMQSVQRTTAHFLSTRSQGLGGVAWLNVLCASPSSGYGYAFSDIQSGGRNPLPAYSWEVMVIAHETGHNFGSPHTHSCTWNPPIDTCYVGSETTPCYSGGCAVNSTCVPRLGTIMSYCHLTSVGTALYFGPLPSTLIRSQAESAVCLDVNSAGIRLGYPNGGEVFATMGSSSEIKSTIITWGANFSDNVNLEFSTDSGATWALIATVPGDQREYTWMIPYIQTTDDLLVRVTNTSIPSQRDTSDGTFTIKLKLWNVTCKSPLNKAQIHVASDNYDPVTFTWSSAGPLQDITYKFYIRRKSAAEPSVVWSTGNDTTFTILAHDLDSILTSWNAWVADSVQCYWYGVAYNNEDTMRATPRFEATFRQGEVLGVGSEGRTPGEFALLGNYPNPFNPSTTIHYQIPSDGAVTLRIYNTLGQEIRTVLNEQQSAGRKSIVWDGRADDGNWVSSGIYVYRLEVQSNGKAYRAARKMVMMK